MSPTSRRRHALGQHFLSNLAAAGRMVELFSPVAGETIVEIGPGRGVLTGLLLDAGARVIAIEIDRELSAGLKLRFADHEGFRLIEADVLRCDLSELTTGGPARVLANLPYAITGEVLMRLFRSSGALTDMMLMLQREVVNRIVAPPGGRIYGSLSVLAQY
ncbi:MAG TPA: rRNA adenine dimethyltransferase family protein, partial [Patescibacteria group bacterium]|nr:rRNA adenine dimethyltransferase family protein [Patescibacteria group bacterium]